MEKQQITKQQLIAELTRSPHGDLQQYLPSTIAAAKHDSEFLAHLIAWNEHKGQIRDSKVALPIVSLIPGFAFPENSLAHMAKLDPRNLVRAVRFAKQLNASAQVKSLQENTAQSNGGLSSSELSRPMGQIKRTVQSYLRSRETNARWFEKSAMYHRRSLQELYALLHIKPSPHADAILFKDRHPTGSLFHTVAHLKDMSAHEAAAAILRYEIPFLTAVSAIGRKPDADLMVALIERMSATQLIANTKVLESWGMNNLSAVRGTYDMALSRAAASKKATLKTTEAARSVGDKKVKAKLVAAQEKQLQALGTIDGNWLVLGDKSSSMVESIDTAKLVAATLAKMVAGEVSLVFFDSAPRAFDVTGKTYDQIRTETQYISEGGSTSIGCGAQYALEKGFAPDGIAIISDGAENVLPMFVSVYERLCKNADRALPVYLYWTKCFQANPYNNDPERLLKNMHAAGHEVQLVDLRSGVDYNSLPNVIQTMRVNRYSLIDEILATPLLTFAEVFNQLEVSNAGA